MIPVHILNIQTDSRELKRLAPKPLLGTKVG